MALRHLTHRRGVPRERPAPDRRSVRRPQRRRGLPIFGAASGRPRVRRQVGDPSVPGRARERRVHTRRRRDRPRATDPRRDGDRGEARSGRRVARRTTDRRRLDPDGDEPRVEGRSDPSAFRVPTGLVVNIHEYQAKELLKAYGIPVPAGEVAYSDRAAARVAEDIGGSRWVVKAQVHAGARGKAGGVRIASSVDDLRRITDELIGTRLVTEQTGADGQLVQRVLVERACRIDREFYVGFTVDRASQRTAVIASADGGVDVETVARDHPERIHTEIVDPATGLLEFQCRKLASAIGLAHRTAPFVRLLKRLERLFEDKDATLLEINPLVVTEEG